MGVASSTGLLLLLPLALAACGRSDLDLPPFADDSGRSGAAGMGGMGAAAGMAGMGATMGMGGDGGASTHSGPPPVPEFRSFDVTATIALTPEPGRPPSWATFPTTHPFTLSLDATAHALIAGALASGGLAGVTTADGRTFTTEDKIEMRVALGNCGPFIRYDEMVVTIDEDRLRGTARGQATLVVGDTVLLSGFTATLGGTRDLTAPSLRLPTDETLTNPLFDTTFTATEPMPTTAQARLVDANGNGQTLGANVDSGPIPFLEAFTKMSVVLAYGQTYQIFLGDLIDFAGNPGPADALTFTTRPLPPLLPEDGFESSAGPTVGGAMVLDGTTRWPAIHGKRSVVISGAGDTLLAGPSRELSVRLAVHAGDTVIRFSEASISLNEAETFLPLSVRFGTPGGIFGSVFGLVGLPTKKMVSTSGAPLPAFVSEPKTFEFPIPTGSGPELVFELAGDEAMPCSVTPEPVDAIIDDLRVE